MKNLLRFVFTYTFCLLHTFSLANSFTGPIKKEYGYKRYGINEGMPENACWDIYQDSKGFIWFATYNGIAVFDGLTIRPIRSTQTLNTQKIVENKGIHVLSNRGFFSVLSDEQISDDKRTDLRFVKSTSKQLPSNMAVYKDSIGNKAIYEINDTITFKWSHPYLKKTSDYQSIYFDRQNNYYIPTENKVYIISQEGNVSDSINIQGALSITEHKDVIFIVNDKGLFNYRDKKLYKIFDIHISYDPIMGINMIPYGESLIIGDWNKVYRYNNNTLEEIFKGKAICDILSDTEGNLWIADYGGLYCFFRLQFKNYVPMDPNTAFRSITVMNDVVYAGTMNGRLYNIDKDNQTELNTPLDKNNEVFQGVSSVVDDKLFFHGYFLGYHVLTYQKGRWAQLKIRSNCYYSLPYNNSILFVSNNYLSVCDLNGNIIREYDREQLDQSQLSCVAAQDGKLFVGGSNGITVIDGNNIKLHWGSYCKVIYADRKGNVYAAQKNYLKKYDGTTFVDFYEFEDEIRSIYQTKSGVLIVTTIKTIHIYNAADNNFIQFDQYNGFTGEKILPQIRMFEQMDGKVWLCADKHITAFYPDRMIKDQPIPRLHLLSMFCSSDNVNWEEKSPSEIRLKYNENNIRFKYIGLCFSGAQNVKYSHRLIGFQEKWSNPGSLQEVVFNNLPPGKYIFQLKAIVGSQQSGEISIPVEITPAFWQTFWFAAVCALAFGVIVALIVFKYINVKTMKKLRILERQKQLNSLAIQSIRLRSIPHFNANVLAGIEYFIMNFSREEANHYLGLYSDFTNITLHDIDLSARSLQKELHYVNIYLNLEKMRFGKKFDYEIDVDESLYPVMIPNMILHTHCENALKHGIRPILKDGKITVKAAKINDKLVSIIIEDNGVGRKKAKQLNTQGAGKGLAILTKQIDLYNETNIYKITQKILDLNDIDGKPCGTRIEIEIPFEYHYM